MLRDKLKLVVFLILVNLFLPSQHAKALTNDDAYKAIVKIYTYIENDNYELELIKSGSGIILNNDGIVLTNSHVVTEENSENNLGFKICLTVNTTEEPVCDYYGDLVAKDDDKDIALLQINTINQTFAKVNYDYLDRLDQNNLSNGDIVTALGYPAIGGNTITITSGSISGQIEKHALNWIKTDTLFSHGSSGGALVSDQGKLIGITSAAYSDMVGSLGYVIDITSVNDWIDENIGTTPQISEVNTRLKDLINVQNQIKTSNTYTNSLPEFSITRNDDFEFIYNGGKELSIGSKENENGGMIQINWEAMPIETDKEYIDVYIKQIEVITNFMMQALNDEEVTVNGVKGKKVVYLVMDEAEMSVIYLPIDNYLLTIILNYGEEDVDKAVLDEIVNTIEIKEKNDFTITKNYSSTDPYMRLNLGGDWALLAKNSKDNPIEGANTVLKELSFSVAVNEVSENVQLMTDEKYLEKQKSTLQMSNMMLAMLGFTMEVSDDNYDYYINDKLNSEIFYKTIIKKTSGEILAMDANIIIREGDNDFALTLSYFGEDEDTFDKNIEKFRKEVAANFDVDRKMSKVREDDANEAEDKNEEQYDEDEVLEEDLNEDESNQEEEVIPVPEIDNSISQSTEQFPSIELTNDFSNKLKGKILLKVEDKGRAWYLSPKDDMAYFLGRPADAFSVMQEQGVGISNNDLNKIPVGMVEYMGKDSDSDGLTDDFEKSIGTDLTKSDTDGDGYNDKEELISGYDPLKSSVQFSGDNNFSDKQKGKILLQVESNGEAWYVNPNDSKRYFLGRPSDAFSVMRSLGLGISNNDFDNIK